MAADQPLHRLPHTVTLELGETAEVLAALDAAIDADVPGHVERRLLSAGQLLTTKLWPELGRLLSEEE